MTGTFPTRIWIEHNAIHYSPAPTGSWTLPLADLVVFDEYTNPSGPFLDDYYFVFVVDFQHAYGASFYSEGRERFLGELSERLGVQLECGLLGSTDFASNVLWPPDLAGQPLYQFAEKPTPTIGAKLLRWFGIGGVDATYSPQVLAKLERSS
jgi:hypothetical protein